MPLELFKRNMYIDIPEKCPMTEMAYGEIKSHGKKELLGKRNVRIIEVKDPETKIIMEGGWFFHPLDLIMPGIQPEPVPLQMFDPENLFL
jgi:hypothetical protein